MTSILSLFTHNYSTFFFCGTENLKFRKLSLFCVWLQVFTLQSFPFFVKSSHWNNMKVSKCRKNCNFGVNYPFKMSFCVWVSLVWSSQCVTNCMLCLRAVTGVDVEPDLVHMEIQDIGGGKGAHVFIEQCISIQFYIPYQTTANKGRWDVLGLQFASFKKTSFREIPPGWAVL